MRPREILYVEDYRPLLMLVRELLESEGWQVETCENGIEALKKLESETHYDLVLLDHDLPGMDGLELVRRARQMPHRQRVPIIMLSASRCQSDALEAGANLFLRKPEDVDSLSEAIKLLFDAPDDLANH